MSTDDDDDRRREAPIGRREEDIERAAIRREVHREFAAQRWRWLAVWLLTLVFSSLAWWVSERNADRTARAVATSRANTVKVICEAINGNAAASNAQTDFLRELVLAQTSASRPFDGLYRKYGGPSYEQRLAAAQATAAGLSRRKVPVLPCDDFERAVKRNATVLPQPTPVERVKPDRVNVPRKK